MVILKMSFLVVVLTLAFLYTGFGQTSNTMSYGILIDNTGSIRRLLPRQQEIGIAVVEHAKTKGPVSIYGFASAETKPGSFATFASGLECSTDAVQLAKQLNDIGITGGQTTLFDAINSAANRLKNPVSPQCKKTEGQVLIVITDGEDRASTLKLKELISAVKLLGVKIYLVGLLENMSTESGFLDKSPSKMSKETLLKLVSEGDSRLVFPKKNDTGEEIITKLFATNYVHPK